MEILSKVLVVGLLLFVICGDSLAEEKQLEVAGIQINGTVRFRAEARDNQNFADTSTNSFLLQQIRLTFSKKFGVSSLFKLTVQDARTLGSNGNVTSDDEGLGVYEGYLQTGLTDWVSLKIGRQALKYGKERLLSPLGWSNTGRTFEGLKVMFLKDDDHQLDILAMKLVENISPGDIDRELYGIYYINKNEHLPFDLYYLSVDNDAAFSTRHTYGVRIEKEMEGLRLDGEYVLQRGDASANTDIDADAWVVRAEYTLGGEIGWRIRGEINRASGDDPTTASTNEQFDHLFPLKHAYNGWMDIHNWENLKQRQLGIGAKNLGGFSGWLMYHSFESEQTAAGASDDLGDEIDFTLAKKFRDVLVKAGYSKYDTGDARTAPNNFDQDWGWLQVSAQF